MKNICTFFLTMIAFTSVAQDTYTKDILSYRYEQNLKFHDKATSPLTKEGLKEFTALSFFKVDERYRIIAKLEKTVDATIFEMPTTTARKPLYIKYGTLTFMLDGKEHQLSIYQNKDFGKDPQYRDYLFLPFTDKTSGTASYGGGRFLDVLTTDEKADGTIVLDFNKAYNPYCAYSGRYSCPITPKENAVSTAIKAGVKAYEKH
jgi:uncharacterized protein (DUF1684 family)